MKKSVTQRLTRCAVIAGLYCAITILFAPISFASVQFRVAECLCVLPIFYGEAIIGLTIGCFISNVFGNGVMDIVFGTLATFVASFLTYITTKNIKNTKLKFFVGCIFPIIINALVIPFTFLLITDLKNLYFLSSLSIFAGESVVILLLGGIVYFKLLKLIYG